MSFARTVARGTTRLLGGVVAAKILDFAFYLLLARKLGVASFGLYTFALSFTLLFNILADFGLASIFARETTRTPARTRLLLGDACRLKLGLALLTFAATSVVARASGAPADTLPLIALLTAGMLLNSLAVLFEALLKSAGRAGVAGLALLAQSGTALAAGASLLRFDLGATAGAIAYLLAALVHLAGTGWLARNEWRTPAPAGGARPWRERLALLREAAPLALSGAFIAIYFRIDAVMLQALQGERAVGLYGGIHRLFEAAAPLAAAYHSVLFPALVRAARGGSDALDALVRQSLRLLCLAAVGFSVFVALRSAAIVETLLGQAYLPAAPGFSILIWALPAALLSTTLLGVLTATGRQALGTWAVGATALANVVLNLLLIPRFSFLGAAIATVASELLCVALLAAMVRGQRAFLELATLLGPPAVAGIALAATLAAGDPLLPRGAAGLALAALVGVLVYLAPLVGLGAVGGKEARLLLDILPAAGRRPPARPAPGIGADRSPWRRLEQKGGRNALRLALKLAFTRAFSHLYSHWLRIGGVRVGRGCLFLGPVEIIGDPRRIAIGDQCILHPGTCLWTHDRDAGHGAITLARGVVLQRRVIINSYVHIQIGEGSGLGDGCYIQDNDHGTAPGVPFLEQPVRGLPIAIGADVWIGARCIVLKGVSIGDHAVIGAGSVVVKSVPADVVAVGVPCRPVKRRDGGRLHEAAA